MPRGGIVFFPLGSSITAGPLTITQQNTTPKTVWFDDAAKTATSPNGDKLYADGSGSWEAYVLNGNMFLKRFADVPATAQPTGEGEIDVYPGAGFLEFEEQGPYTQIAASGSLTFSVEWKAVKVPTVGLGRGLPARRCSTSPNSKSRNEAGQSVGPAAPASGSGGGDQGGWSRRRRCKRRGFGRGAQGDQRPHVVGHRPQVGIGQDVLPGGHRRAADAGGDGAVDVFGAPRRRAAR